MLFPLLIFLIVSVETAFRYENRTISCHENDECTLTAPDTKVPNLDLNIKCHREAFEKNKQRLACPIRCPKDYEVHVLQKIASSSKKCVKFYTYGKYADDNEWFIWMIEPCITTISTHCRYPELKK